MLIGVFFVCVLGRTRFLSEKESYKESALAILVGMPIFVASAS